MRSRKIIVAWSALPIAPAEVGSPCSLVAIVDILHPPTLAAA
jgi:hypothetical protein